MATETAAEVVKFTEAELLAFFSHVLSDAESIAAKLGDASIIAKLKSLEPHLSSAAEMAILTTAINAAIALMAEPANRSVSFFLSLAAQLAEAALHPPAIPAAA